MTQRDMRMIGGIYRQGQIISTNGILTTCTAYNHNTNDVVGLFIIEYTPTLPPDYVRQILQPLQQRQHVRSTHVLPLHNWGIDGSRVYIATDPPRGTTLQHVLHTENIDFHRAVDIIRQLATGLKTLHEKGIAGIDLRPQFITVDQLGRSDRAQIDDIGLRTLLNALGYQPSQPDTRASDIGDLDPRYAPPEYINREQVGPYSDIYQLGLLLFELITGRPPFVGRTPAETGILQNTNPVPRMIQFKHDTPTSLQDVIDCALEKEPSRRFGSATALLQALETIQLPTERVTAQGIRSTQLTGEMPTVGYDEDVTLRATVIERTDPELPIVGATQPVSQDEGVYAYLCFEQDGKEAQRFTLTQKSSVVGRTDPKRNFTPDIDLTELDPTMTVSRQHARIRFEETFFYIEDTKSRNKTRLGELVLTPLKAELLQHGDILHFGSVRLKFKIPGMPDRPVFKEKPSSVG